jgi:hypothetical protein
VGTMRQTNPIGPGGKGVVPPESDRAKQTQFPPQRLEGQRLGGKGVMVNSTFDRPRQNKANSGGSDAPGGTTGGVAAWAQCAKQTQSAPGGPAGRGTNKANWAGRQRRRHRRARSCETKPIGGSEPCQTKPILRLRIVQNEANLRSPGRPDGLSTRHRMPATPSWAPFRGCV